MVLGVIYLSFFSYSTGIVKIPTQTDANGIRPSQIDLERYKYNIETQKNDQTPVMDLYIHQ